MTAANGTTRYADLTRGQAVLVLLLLVASFIWFQAGALTPIPDPVPRRDASGVTLNDVELYRAIIGRVRAGEGYYDAVGTELRTRHYPVRPLFNWRQPTYAWLLSRLPHPYCGNALLAAIGAAVLASSYRWMLTTAGRARARSVGLLVGVSVSSSLVPEYVFFQETWAALLMALSICFYAHDRWRPAVMAGLAALAFREFALLPCALALLLAIRRGRRPEVIAWIAGLGIYAVLLSWHAVEVTRHFQADDPGRGWVAFGGSAFLVAAGRWSPLTIALPGWAIAMVLPLSLFGLAGWRDPIGARLTLTVAGYLVAFTVLGNPCNNYWGMLFAPLLLPFGLPWVRDSAQDLWRVVTRRRSSAIALSSNA